MMKRVGGWDTRKEAASMQKPVWGNSFLSPTETHGFKNETSSAWLFQPFVQAAISTMAIPRRGELT